MVAVKPLRGFEPKANRIRLYLLGVDRRPKLKSPYAPVGPFHGVGSFGGVPAKGS